MRINFSTAEVWLMKSNNDTYILTWFHTTDFQFCLNLQQDILMKIYLFMAPYHSVHSSLNMHAEHREANWRSWDWIIHSMLHLKKHTCFSYHLQNYDIQSIGYTGKSRFYEHRFYEMNFTVPPICVYMLNIRFYEFWFYEIEIFWVPCHFI